MFQNIKIGRCCTELIKNNTGTVHLTESECVVPKK